MACFVVPLTQAIATTAYRKRVERTQTESAQSRKNASLKVESNLRILEQMLWGGSIMLVLDHIINGEVTWQYPFFTALATEGGAMVMLKEMLFVGVPMSVLVTVVWAAYCYLKERKAIKA